MKSLPWSVTLSYWSRRVGVVGWMGAACMVAALLYFALELVPAARRVRTLGESQAALQLRLTQQSDPQRKVEQSPAQQLASFFEDFPTDTDIPGVLANIYDVAAAHKLALEFGEYSFTPSQNGRLDQFRITLPVKGSYPQIRQFASEVLEAHPALALESLALRREKLAEDVVDGRLVLLLFLEHSP